MLKVQRKLDFVGLHGYASACDVFVYTDTACGRCVVVFSERPDNPGTSITNFIEHLVPLVQRELDVPGDSIWIEHYPADKRIRNETYDRVVFEGRLPCWQSMSVSEFNELISEAACI